MQTPITISELNSRIRSVVEDEFRFVFVTGEISNFKHHITSGHYYFVLKDRKSQVSAVMWQSVNKNLIFTPEDGMNVIVKGRIRLYESRGTYNVEIFEMIPAGIGELQIAFEQLKQRLWDEGLFDESRKRPLPKFPQRVGIITSETGAVIKDFVNIMTRRYPLAELLLFPVNVQGLFAKESVTQAIKEANKSKYGLDVLVIARGGGSLEDLWTFNEEEVARGIFKSKVPVVSAIGHEVDFTICDFVADLRAPTPSAAAEIIFPDSVELLERVNQFEYYINRFVGSKINTLTSELDLLENSYSFRRLPDLISESLMDIDEMESSIEKSCKVIISDLKNRLSNMNLYISGLDPIKNLQRGYSIVRMNSVIVNKGKILKPGDDIEIEFSDTSKKSKITA